MQFDDLYNIAGNGTDPISSIDDGGNFPIRIIILFLQRRARSMVIIGSRYIRHDEGHGISHSHEHEKLPGKREHATRPTTTKYIDNADESSRNGNLRVRVDRKDKGDF